MKFTKEEREEIGRLIYTKEMTIGEACAKYDINRYTVRDYMRDYRDANQLPPMSTPEKENEPKPKKPKKETLLPNYEELKEMSKEELIDEIIKKTVEAERAKKGYAVKGGGQEKEFINLSNGNSK